MKYQTGQMIQNNTASNHTHSTASTNYLKDYIHTKTLQNRQYLHQHSTISRPAEFTYYTSDIFPHEHDYLPLFSAVNTTSSGYHTAPIPCNVINTPIFKQRVAILNTYIESEIIEDNIRDWQMWEPIYSTVSNISSTAVDFINRLSTYKHNRNVPYIKNQRLLSNISVLDQQEAEEDVFAQAVLSSVRANPTFYFPFEREITEQVLSIIANYSACITVYDQYAKINKEHIRQYNAVNGITDSDLTSTIRQCRDSVIKLTSLIGKLCNIYCYLDNIYRPANITWGQIDTLALCYIVREEQAQIKDGFKPYPSFLVMHHMWSMALLKLRLYTSSNIDNANVTPAVHLHFPIISNNQGNAINTNRITTADMIVRTHLYHCIFHNHKVEPIKALIGVRVKTPSAQNLMRIQDFTLNAIYCHTCGQYFLPTYEYKKIKAIGSPQCRIVSYIDYYSKSTASSSFGADSSPLMEYGYNVNAQEKLTSTERRARLTYIIDNGILSVYEVISYLELFINQHKDMPKYHTAIQKWSSDLHFIRNYKPQSSNENKQSSQRSVRVSGIIEKQYRPSHKE